MNVKCGSIADPLSALTGCAGPGSDPASGGRRTVLAAARRAAGLGALAAALSLTAGLGPARAQMRAFNIPAKPAAKAIADFARQSGIQVIAPTRQLRGVTTPAVVGTLDAREALDRLLVSTGLEVAQDSGALIVLRTGTNGRPPPPPAAALRMPAAETIAEVIVTANREETAASKTPVALTALSGDQLMSRGVADPTQLSGAIPNLTINRANGLQITIRGVTSSDGTEKGDPSASFLINGVYIARPQAQEVSFFDLARVEVLRGPQGTLYGRNTTAGVVNVISAPPTFDHAARTDLTVEAYEALQATGVLNLRLAEGLALRLAGDLDVRDTYLRQAVTQATTVPKYRDAASLRASLLYAPGERLEVRVVADASRVRDVQSPALLSNFYALPFAPPAATGGGTDPARADRDPRDARARRYASVQQDEVRNRIKGVLTQVSYAPDEAWRVTWLGSYRDFERRERANTFRGSQVTAAGEILGNTVLPSLFLGDYRQQSHEVRVARSGARLQGQAGLYYFRETYDIGLYFLGYQGQPGQRGYIFGFPQLGWARSVGIFGQLTYSLHDRWRITMGARQTGDDKFRDGATVFRASLDEANNFTPSTTPGVTNPGGFRDSRNLARLETNKATWRLSTDVDLTPGVMGFASVSTGYKAGGFNDGCLAGAAHCHTPLPEAALFYRPEEITSYEVGVKAGLWGNRLRVNATAFHYDYDNLQLSQLSDICGAPCQVTSNAAKARIDGVELDGAWAIDARSRVEFAATWLDARYADWRLTPTFNFAGATLDRSPRWAFAGAYTYTHPLPNGSTLEARLRARYSDRYSLTSAPLRARFWQPSFTRTDLSLAYSEASGRWELQGFVRNLENTIEVTSAALAPGFPALNNGTTNIGDPRTYGLRLTGHF